MTKKIILGAMLASSLALAACGGSKTASNAQGSAASNTAGKPADNAAAPAPAAAANASGNASGAAASNGQASDATNQNFTLRNRTGHAVNEVYVSAVSTDNWEEDVLGRDTLPNGEAVEITFERSETQCNWDLKLVFDNGQSMEQRNVNLCRTGEIEVAP